MYMYTYTYVHIYDGYLYIYMKVYYIMVIKIILRAKIDTLILSSE